MINPTKCQFCLENELIQADLVYQDELWYFIKKSDGGIRNAGMAITKRHIETPFELNIQEWRRLYTLLPKFKALLDVETPQGYNIGWNVYATGGQHVAHAHLHMIARYDDEPLAGKGIKHAFKQVSNHRPPQTA